MALRERLELIWKRLKKWRMYGEYFRSAALGTLILVLGVLCIGLLQGAKDARAYKAQMKDAVSTYSSQAKVVNDATGRAVETKQVPDVRQDLASKAQDYGLKVETGSEPLYRDGTGEVYEMRLRGSWQRTAGFLEHLQPKDALLGLRMVQMNGTEAKVDTVMQVKIYTKQVK